LGLLQAFFSRQGAIWVELGPLALTRGGLLTGLYVAGRFVGVVLLSYLYVLTTDPNGLAYALMQAGLPYRFGFALVTALRMVPMFEREAQIVYEAQLVRGVRYNRRLIRVARQFFFPLLVSALGKADTLAASMEGRCFGRYPTRTFLCRAQFALRDGAALAVLGVLSVLVGLALWS
jgi:energy-coupling factor transport system permease protein